MYVLHVSSNLKSSLTLKSLRLAWITGKCCPWNRSGEYPKRPECNCTDQCKDPPYVTYMWQRQCHIIKFPITQKHRKKLDIRSIYDF